MSHNKSFLLSVVSVRYFVLVTRKATNWDYYNSLERDSEGLNLEVRKQTEVVSIESGALKKQNYSLHQGKI
jgi:hypothetical protein